MSSQEMVNNPATREELDESQQEETSLASKLSKELSNWRRRRGNGGGRSGDPRMISKPQLTEPARTIKVRGHETLVIRKSKLAAKTRNDTAAPRD